MEKPSLEHFAGLEMSVNQTSGRCGQDQAARDETGDSRAGAPRDEEYVPSGTRRDRMFHFVPDRMLVDIWSAAEKSVLTLPTLGDSHQ